jgi:hypothetical protein
MTPDPFSEFRKSQSSFDAVTGTDGRTLQLVAIDLAQFHPIAHAAIEIANRHGWRVTRLHRVGANIERLTVTPHR